jgi:hypothetical protein
MTRSIGHFQARYFGLAAFPGERVAVRAWWLCINLLNVERQTGHFPSDFHAKRAGFVLVQGQALALLINALLGSFWANDAFGLSQFFLEQHHWPKDDAQAFEEVTDQDFHHLNVFRFARI